MLVKANICRMSECSEIIDSLGGTNAVARLCEIRPASVSKWRTNGIPKGWMMFFKCQFPHLFNPQEE